MLDTFITAINSHYDIIALGTVVVIAHILIYYSNF